MWISQLYLKNIRGFINSKIQFSKGINIILGPNNAGKSTILKSLFILQNAKALLPDDLRMWEPEGEINITFQGDTKKYYPPNLDATNFQLTLPSKRRILFASPSTHASIGEISNSEPNNFIYPYLSKRKVLDFDEQINLGNAVSVTGNFVNLYPKIDRISNPQFLPAYDEYIKACDEILGFRVTCTASHNGKKGAYIVKNLNHIPLDGMGEGVANLLGLIVDLCIAENKLFLIEEPENDIHPKALKNLLKMIIKKSQNNQFVITTHSNIVTKYLGAQKECKIFHVAMTFKDKLPTSIIGEVGESPEERRNVLEELGYELFDFDLWDCWLILEESSAEKIIREYLIPWFIPAMRTKLRTFSAHSISEVESKFKDFNNLFVFLHLQPTYKNRVWVVVDGGDREKEIIDKLREIYMHSGWNKKQFIQLSEHDFEKYYPKTFQEKVDELLAINDKQAKRMKKKTLLEELESWIKEDEERAKKAFANSASDVIDILRNISASVDSTL